MDEANSAFRTFEIERLAVHKLFVATFSVQEAFYLFSGTIGIVAHLPNGYAFEVSDFLLVKISLNDYSTITKPSSYFSLCSKLRSRGSSSKAEGLVEEDNRKRAHGGKTVDGAIGACSGRIGFGWQHLEKTVWNIAIKLMDKGFLNRISNGSKEVNKGLLEKGSLLGNIAAKVKNIDGKILGRDGKPMVARRCVRFSEMTKESACGDGHDVIVDSSKVEHSPQAVAKCAVHDDGTRPVHGRNDTRVNDLNSHTNDAPVEHVISSAVCLPMEAIDEIKARFVNTLYGFPVGKRLAFPMVENYVKYAWAKYGLKRVMMHHGFFMFQFDSDSGMVKVMEDGPWRIQLVPIILNVWRPNTLLQKDKVTHVLLWLKMHNVPIVAYSKVGLDLISAKDGNGYTTTNIRIEFEWQPPRCGTCKIFDHLDSVCPIKRVAGPLKQSDMQADEKKDKQLVQATGKKGKGKQVGNQRYIKGYRVNIPKSKLVYRAVVKPQGDKNVVEHGAVLGYKLEASLMILQLNGIYQAVIKNFVIDLTSRLKENQKAKEESVIEFIGNNTNDGCTLRGKQDDKISSKKPSSSLEVINEDSDTDVDEVLLPDIGTSFPSSSFGGGQSLEKEILNAYDDDYEDQFEE
ncbi:zinc knuckle CX2CX4HX4C containing protein [Tanacetum coccineum]